MCGRWQDTTMIIATEKILEKLKVLLSLLAILKWAAFDNVDAPFVSTLCKHWHDWSWLSPCLWKINLSLWWLAYLCYLELILHIMLEIILNRWDAACWKEGKLAAKALWGTWVQKWLNPQSQSLTTSFVLNICANTGPHRWSTTFRLCSQPPINPALTLLCFSWLVVEVFFFPLLFCCVSEEGSVCSGCRAWQEIG